MTDEHDRPPAPSSDIPAPEASFSTITGADPSDVTRGEARNGLIHVISLTMSKTADGLIDPKLVLSWLLSALGAPGAMVGLLVPVREAGALLPQLLLSRRVEGSPQRKRFWSWGSALQGIAALTIAVLAVLGSGALGVSLSGAVAGGGIVLALAGLAVARAASSVSQKDALARTVAKQRRGALTGLAGSLASGAVFAVGLVMATGLFATSVLPLAGLVAVAGLAFLLAAAAFLLLREPKARPEGGEDDGSLQALVEPIFADGQLRIFVASRAALAVTALAPPFIVMLSAASGRSALSDLGPLVMASTAASVLAAYVWGRLSDRSSRQTLMVAGALGAVAYALIGAVGLTLQGLGGVLWSAAAVFAAQIAYEGVRAGRKLHLTDMAEDSFRARYTALSNTLIGLALLAGGGFGLLADAVGPGAVLLLFAGIAAAGVLLASRLEEVQQDG